MSLGVTIAYDVTGANYNSAPANSQLCGYDTGSGGVAWTPQMFAVNTGSVHIDQSPVNTAQDEMSDVLDYEKGAATLDTLAPWVNAAHANYNKNARPGQRQPAIYASANDITDVVNALVAGGVLGGVGLWIANWNLSEAQAVAAVFAASGPFPVIAVQFSDMGGGGLYDLDIFSRTWLSTQSGVTGNTVSAGASGPAVAALQRRLTVWGQTVTQDGLFGAGTMAALQKFQRAHALTADGIAGPATWTALEKSPVTPPPPPPPPPPGPVPAPLDLRQSAVSSGSAVTFSWGAVHGQTSYDLQLEFYKPQFGWVLTGTTVVTGTTHSLAVAPRTKFRWRVAAAPAGHIWSPWVQFTTS